MSPRAWRSALIGSAVLWALIFGLVFGCRAAAAPVSEAPTFLARYGLDASAMPPIVFVDEVDDAYPGSPNSARATRDAVLMEHPEGADAARVFAIDVLHEALHYASFWRWVYEPCAIELSEAWMLRYEEGLVQATADALMPNWWRYLTGRRLNRDWWYVNGYREHVIWWRALAQRATGSSWRSRAGREWLVGALALSPADRTALAYRTESGPAALPPGAVTNP